MKKILFTISMLVISGADAYPQITFHDIVPDTVVNTWNAFGISPSISTSNYFLIWWHPSPEVVIQTNGNCQIQFDATGGLPAKLNFGDSISSLCTWKAASYDALNSGGTGNWQTSATDKYLGFRFKNATAWLYGWLKMSVATGGTSFTVKEWAFNASGAKINAGHTAATTELNIIQDQNKLQLYPNPASGKIQLVLIADADMTLSVMDINGKIFSTVPVNKGQHNPSLDISTLPKGLYYVQIRSGTDLYNCTFVKQ